jgi:hypothetical protein
MREPLTQTAKGVKIAVNCGKEACKIDTLAIYGGMRMTI